MDAAQIEHELLRDVTARRADRRVRAAERLRSEPPESAIALLLRLLADQRANVQEAAADALRTMSDPRGRAALVRALDDRSEWTRVIAARSLAADHEPLAWPVLEAAFASDDVDVVGPAMEGIWRFGHPRACAITERIARDADEYPCLREMAVRTLGWEGTRESVPAIEAALADKRRYVRKAARDAIAQLKARTAKAHETGPDGWG